MNQHDFQNFRALLLMEARKINDEKGVDYGAEEDVLANFKRQGARWDVPALKVWAVYFGKHIDALETFVKKGNLRSESVRGRVHDILNYLILGLALIEEDES